MMCGAAESSLPLSLRPVCTRDENGRVLLFLAACPDTGVYTAGGRDWKDAQTPEAFTDSCTKWAALGARIDGGCCGYGPEHIRVMSTCLAGGHPDAAS